jgi:photosystem II stability/assembly factor-like uncharacterized protein
VFAVPSAGGQLALVLNSIGPRREHLLGPTSTRAYGYATADGGQHWAGPRALPGAPSVVVSRRLAVLDDAHWWWGTGTDVYFSSDQGRHWAARGALPRPEQLGDLDFVNATDGWALASSTTGRALFATSDGGRTWAAVTPPDPVE